MGVEGLPTFSGPLSPEQTIIFQSAAVCNDFQIAVYMCTYILKLWLMLKPNCAFQLDLAHLSCHATLCKHSEFCLMELPVCFVAVKSFQI